ncbi:MAG TPA: glycine zipper 2TM domain-containing protein [Novosphingobium sp.]|nr:glycine zipper 2TM domain-containing protein [Novosphingobium sp.]
MKKTLLALAAFAATAAALPVAPAFADQSWSGRDDRRDRRDDRRDYRDDRRDDRRDYRGSDRRGYQRSGIYDSRGRYAQPRRIDRNSRVWRGNDGRYYCKRDNGTTGLIIGAGVGALAGNQIAGSRDKTIGTILGGVLGGVAGREIDKGDMKCR